MISELNKEFPAGVEQKTPEIFAYASSNEK